VEFRGFVGNEGDMAAFETKIWEDWFVMDGLSASTLTDKYVQETLPDAGIDAIHKTVAGTGDDFEVAIEQIRELQTRIAAWDGVSQARSVDDLRASDDLQILFGFQDSTPLERDPENVRLFKQLGVRIIQLSYNSRNLCANGCTERVDDGISNYGIEVIEAIEEHGILLDLSHVGPQSALEALEVASQPTVFSHSNPNGVHDHPRNIADEHIKAAIETGGVVGINAYPDFVGDDPSIERLVEHVKYLDDIVGAKNVTLGLDFVDNRPAEELQSLKENPYYSDPPYQYPEGLRSAADVPNLVNALLNHGFTESEVQGIMGQNLLRVYESVWDN
jgi:membrane dipeptidase